MIQRVDITARLQHRLLEIVSTALPLITRSIADADLLGLAHLRGEMIHALDAYYCHVSKLNADAGRSADECDRLTVSCVELRAAYEAFRARWVFRNGAESWHEYRLSAVVMMKHVRSIMQEADAIEAIKPFGVERKLG